jgi:hypothetical protein
MCKVGVWSLAFCVIVPLILGLPCAFAEDVQPINAMLDRDFSSELEQSEYFTLNDIHNDAPGLFDTNNAILKSIREYVPEREFTTKELHALGGWRATAQTLFLVDTLHDAYEYYLTHGCLPSTGADLFDELTTERGQRVWNDAQDRTLLELYYTGISPITGKFISSFTASSWQPGAWNIEIVRDPAQVRALAKRDTVVIPPVIMPDGSLSGDYQESPVEQVWLVTIYGEQEGDLILKDYVYELGPDSFYKNQQPAPKIVLTPQ